jgi:hypothetical protein
MMTESDTPLIARMPKITLFSLWGGAFLAAALAAHLASPIPDSVGSFARQLTLGGFWGLLCNLIGTACLAYFRVTKAWITGSIAAAGVLVVVMIYGVPSDSYVSGVIKQIVLISALSIAIYSFVISIVGVLKCSKR